jgi:hypothetical protein
MHIFRWSILLLALGCVLQGCASRSSYYSTEIKHRSVKDCLRVIQLRSASEVKEYYENTPLKVRGNLANGESFGCYYKVTGTDGMYYRDQWSERK